MDTQKLVTTAECALIGGAGGALGRWGANQDAKNIAKAKSAGKEQPMWKQWGLYLNFLAPIGAIVGFPLVGIDGEVGGAALGTAGALLGDKLTYNAMRNHYPIQYVATRPARYTPDPPISDKPSYGSVMEI